MGKLHASSEGKYITLLICIERDMNKEKTEAFGKKNSIGEIPHYFAQAPKELGLQYIPHKTLIGADGKIIKNGTWSLDEAAELLAKACAAGDGDAPSGGTAL